MNLYPKGINLSKLTTKDLKAIAQFHRIIKNYIKMKIIQQRNKKPCQEI